MKNKMRFLGLAVLAMAFMTLAGCQKEENISGDGVHFTTTLKMASGGDKALDASGHKTFAVGDQVAVIYKSTNSSAVQKAVSEPLTESDIRSNGKVANFRVKLLGPITTQPVTYIYPATMAKGDGTVNYDALKAQDGTLASLASNLDVCTFTGNWNGESLPSNATMTNQLAICKFTINDWTSSVTKLTVKNGTDVYFVTPSSSLNEIWVAMKPVTSGNISIYAARGKALYTKTVSGKTLAAGKLYPVSVTTELIPGALSGLFSVNASNDLVYFSQGNLQATFDGSSWSWAFATSQYDYVGDNTANTAIDENGSVSIFGTVDLFGWSTNKTYYGIHNSINNTPYADSVFVDWGQNAISNGGNTANQWRTLSKDEWLYLFSSRNASTVAGITNARNIKAQVNNIHGVILFPDSYIHPAGITAPTYVNRLDIQDGWDDNSYTTDQWMQMEEAGAVFLPAAGSRLGANVSNTNVWGFYWSSDYNNNATPKYSFAYQVDIRPGTFAAAQSVEVRYGKSVRLVHKDE